ncbi:hypothetical protein LshimejAT787_0111220 [Lyophyllum shimeji]|uniref:Uncharacterized protein n=1 Tax=Lyophyllum shimeji TaxID=47721 RepID=A0A9P3UID2_LYOSH|nr:hypothetical protein LshimejAT787_0111220 [Lyophyllum shimeji]
MYFQYPASSRRSDMVLKHRPDRIKRVLKYRRGPTLVQRSIHARLVDSCGVALATRVIDLLKHGLYRPSLRYPERYAQYTAGCTLFRPRSGLCANLSAASRPTSESKVSLLCVRRLSGLYRSRNTESVASRGGRFWAL